MTAYCSIDDVKDRLLIATSDTSYDTALNNAINEASVVCDMFLRAYTTVPLTSPYPDEVRYASADIAASIFKRRMMPEDITLRGALQPDQLNQMDATGWFALGIRKLEQYIKSKYVVQDKPFTSNTVYNPEIYIDLMSKGVITPAEARQYVTGATQATVKELKDVIITLTQTINTTQTLNDTIARAENLTKTLNETITRATNETLNRTQIQQLTDNLTKTLNDTLTQTITRTLNDTISKTANESITRTQTLTDNLTRTLKDTIDKTLTQTLNDTIIRSSNETLKRTQEFTDNLTKALNDTISRALNETINRTQIQTLSDNLTKKIISELNDTITRALNETVNRIIAETSNKTETLDATRTIGEYHKQRQLKIIKGKADSDEYE